MTLVELDEVIKWLSENAEKYMIEREGFDHEYEYHTEELIKDIQKWGVMKKKA